MNPEEITMTETESIQLITSMINKAKNRFNETGILYLLWGWVVLICCVSQFIASYFFEIENAYYIWYLTWLLLFTRYFFCEKKEIARR